MRRVVVESPYAGDVAAHGTYAGVSGRLPSALDDAVGDHQPDTADDDANKLFAPNPPSRGEQLDQGPLHQCKANQNRKYEVGRSNRDSRRNPHAIRRINVAEYHERNGENTHHCKMFGDYPLDGGMPLESPTSHFRSLPAKARARLDTMGARPRLRFSVRRSPRRRVACLSPRKHGMD